MSKTPRTDEQLKLEAFFDGIGIVETVEVEFAQQLEAELADKDKQFAEARAEIERLKCHLEDESMRADGMTTAHAEADARSYRLQELIEQMREALVVADALIASLIDAHVDKCASVYDFDRNIIKAALAAERGE